MRFFLFVPAVDASLPSHPTRKDQSLMSEPAIDRATIERLAKALVFICGADHPATTALKKAAESGLERDIKAARSAFVKLKSGERNAAFSMLEE